MTKRRKSRMFARALASLGGVARSNPSRRENVESAARLLESFTGQAPTKEISAHVPPIKAGLVIGHLEGVMYRATRDGEASNYFHRFRKNSRPLLIAGHDGEQLGIVGGRFRFTDRGIVDK